MKGQMKVKKLNDTGLYISEMDWDNTYICKENPIGNFVMVIEPLSDFDGEYVLLFGWVCKIRIAKREKRMPWNRWFDDSVASSFGGKTGFMILWILELVSYLSVLSWGISFQLVEKPAEIKLIIIPDDFRNFIDGIGCCFK